MAFEIKSKSGCHVSAKKILVVGAGLSGAVICRALAKTDHTATIVDSRNHIAANCSTARDVETGVMAHLYGPHIFYTEAKDVWDYINVFGKFKHYRNSGEATSKDRVYFVAYHTIQFRPVEEKALLAGYFKLAGRN